MCFVPMKFNMANITVGQYHNCDAFQLFPATATMDFLQVSQVADTGTNRNCFNELNIANDFKIHLPSLTSLVKHDK